MMVAAPPGMGARSTVAGAAIATATATPARTARQRIVGALRVVEMR
jgi:hypothetical protein